jgi:hypothetical protein
MKKYTEQEINDMKKALHKMVLKALEKGPKSVAQEVVRDVLDANYSAQVDPDKVPSAGKTGVVNKSKCAKSQDKGVVKLKKFMKRKGKKSI